MRTKTITVSAEEISAARALVAIKGEANVSDVIAAVAQARPGHPVLVRRAVEQERTAATG